MLKAADLFCGAGGTTTGAQASGVVDVVLAVNHWRTAVTTHRHNHPHARHVCAGGPRSVEAPISTFTTKQRHGLVGVELERTMQEFGITDVFFRMLEPAELAAAQGFPATYSIFGSKADQVKQIGNSAHTAVAKAICQSIGGLGV